MTAKYTKGPWRVMRDYDNNIEEEKPGRHTIKAGNGWNVARIWEGHGTETPQEEVDANARLIAAAPDLLEIAKYYFECRSEAVAESEKAMEAKAKAAIALAEGGAE